MAKVFIKNVEKVSFQIGVDVLGFPIYHEHIFMDAVKVEDKTKMKGKNQSKHVVKYHEVMYFTHNQVEKSEENKEARYLRREFSYSKFQQALILPDDVDKDKICAKVENGVLSIELPKLSHEEIHKAQRTIEIS